MTWRNCNASLTLVAAVNARWPGRDKASDGTIGDAAHASRTSDHNPWVVVDGVGVVRARDIDKDGIDAGWLAEELRKLGAAGDPRLAGGGYVIWNRRITSDDFSRWTPYNGSNPHTQHVHVSFSRNRAGFDSNAPWGFLGGVTSNPAPAGRPGVFAWNLPTGHYYGNLRGPAASHGGFYGSERDEVRNIQQWLIYHGCVAGVPASAWATSSWADGKWEGPTDTASRVWHDRFYPGQPYPTQVWRDDYGRLARA
ncbi:hypothetical protein [Amycolatopsis sp. PS_44_ISF1]|uniref:hypothetical protein n=1 Tax=Amycolatopsis sp. PS_44_ISF1 TaxID=2974917 RepID=UPI0028E04775|nr:hypothetical protein [Amycolatopsis sp. PS_44_ISF1]MDT8915792.1 hypothetical protein [Amycolatopsis sp. PS_44_ISF1]MDT8916196.1 hypothetical protein [Amycolatopsis sp. PS_44_ISF1]